MNFHLFAPGDNVVVCEEERRHLRGKILEMNGETVTIMPKHETLKDPMIFSADDLKKWFTIGNFVRVVGGEHKKKFGLILRVDDDLVRLFVINADHFFQEEVDVPNRNLRLFSGFEQTDELPTDDDYGFPDPCRWIRMHEIDPLTDLLLVDWYSTIGIEVRLKWPKRCNGQVNS